MMDDLFKAAKRVVEVDEAYGLPDENSSFDAYNEWVAALFALKEAVALSRDRILDESMQTSHLAPLVQAERDELAAEVQRLRSGLERMRDWPKVGEHGQVLSISHGLLADYIEDILEPK